MITRRRLYAALAAIAFVTTVASAQQENGPAAIKNTPTPMSAVDSALEARTSEVAAVLRCPVCQGLSIQDSPSELSQQMRAVVKDQLRAGKTPAEVKAYFVSKYGEWILLEPKPAGFNMLVYIMPFALVGAGLVGIWVAVTRWSRPTPPVVVLTPGAVPSNDTGVTS